MQLGTLLGNTFVVLDLSHPDEDFEMEKDLK